MFKPGFVTLALAVAVCCALPANASVSRGDRAFVRHAAQAGRGEIVAAQIAIQRGVDGNVRDFAQRMVRDHTMAARQLARIANSEGIALPANLDRTDRDQIAKLRSLSGADFDVAYSQFQVRDHRAAVALFESEANSGSNDRLRSFASLTLPTLRMHQRMSYQVVASLAPTSSLMAHRRH